MKEVYCDKINIYFQRKLPDNFIVIFIGIAIFHKQAPVYVYLNCIGARYSD